MDCSIMSESMIRLIVTGSVNSQRFSHAMRAVVDQ